MGKRLKETVALTDVIDGKEKIIKKTRRVDDVEAWLATRDEHPDRDWRYLSDKIIKVEENE